MSRTRTLRVNTSLSGEKVSRQYEGTHRWEVRYPDPTSGATVELSIPCNSGTSPKEVLESRGVPYDFTVDVTYI